MAFQSLLKGKRLGAHAALEWPLLLVPFGVLLHLLAREEGLLAVHADELGNVRVSALVAMQQCLPCETLVADGALKGPLASVDEIVLGQVVLGEEALLAVRTLEAARARVIQPMDIEQLLQRKGALAIGTGKHVGGHCLGVLRGIILIV